MNPRIELHSILSSSEPRLNLPFQPYPTLPSTSSLPTLHPLLNLKLPTPSLFSPHPTLLTLFYSTLPYPHPHPNVYPILSNPALIPPFSPYSTPPSPSLPYPTLPSFYPIPPAVAEAVVWLISEIGSNARAIDAPPVTFVKGTGLG